MAVYFQKAERPWWSDLAREGLSYLMKSMFERDAYARQKNRSNKEWAQVFGTPAQQVAAQEATQQPAAMTVENSPDTNRLSSAITGATQTSPFGSDAIGFAPNAPKVNVPKQFLPTANDGLLGTSNKAVMANNYVFSQVPSREELMRRVLTTMGPQNQEAAVKYLEYIYGPQWKVGDQINRGRQMENILGMLPVAQDKEGNRNYNNRAYMYGMDNLATGNLNFLNPEYQRWFDEAEAAKQRAFTGRENALNRGTQMAIARMNDNRMRQLAAMRAASGTESVLPKGITEKDLNKAVEDSMGLIADKPLQEAEALVAAKHGNALLPFIKDRLKGLETLTYGAYGDTGKNPFFIRQQPAAASATATAAASPAPAPAPATTTPAPKTTKATGGAGTLEEFKEQMRNMGVDDNTINSVIGETVYTYSPPASPSASAPVASPAETKPRSSLTQRGREKLSQMLQYLLLNQDKLNNPLSNEDEYTQEWVTLGNNIAKSDALKRWWGNVVQARPNYNPYWIR